MTAVEFNAHLAGGRFDVAFSQVTEWVREEPGSAPARAAMCALFCYSEDWIRAYRQLKEWAQLEPAKMMALVGHERCISSEQMRLSVIDGTAPPRIREPSSSLDGWQASVLNASATSVNATLNDLLAARPASTAVGGQINGSAFEGIEDLDCRFGHLIEVFMADGYWLVPFYQVRKLTGEPVTSHFSALWRPVTIDFDNGPVAAFLPTRYPFSGRSSDPLVRLGRKTVCSELFPGFSIGAGQHLYITAKPQADFQSLEIRSLDLGSYASQGAS